MMCTPGATVGGPNAGIHVGGASIHEQIGRIAGLMRQRLDVQDVPERTRSTGGNDRSKILRSWARR
jgi:hypothetical protein